MVDKITKFLKKLTQKERESILDIMKSIKNGETEDMDIKKLKGYKNLYRVRKGKIRIIYNSKLEILEVNTRGHIYKDF